METNKYCLDLVIVGVLLSLPGEEEISLVLVIEDGVRYTRLSVAPPKFMLKVPQSLADEPYPELVLRLGLVLQILPQDDLLPVRSHRSVELSAEQLILLEAGAQVGVRPPQLLVLC